MRDESIPLSLKREALKHQRGIDGNLLHWACNANNLSFHFIKTLVDIGGEKCDTQHDRFRKLPMHFASRYGNIEAMELFLHVGGKAF